MKLKKTENRKPKTGKKTTEQLKQYNDFSVLNTNQKRKNTEESLKEQIHIHTI